MRESLLSTVDQIKRRLRLLSMDAAVPLRAGIMPVLHIQEIDQLGRKLFSQSSEHERN